MRIKIILAVLAVAIIQFALALLTLYKGLLLFHGPTTWSEHFWASAIPVMLFPASMLLHTQITFSAVLMTMMIALNSLIWGGVLVALWVGIRKRYRNAD